MIEKTSKDIWLQILSNLEAKDLLNAGKVNKKLNEASNEEILWKKKCAELNLEKSTHSSKNNYLQNVYIATSNNKTFFIIGDNIKTTADNKVRDIPEQEIIRSFPTKNVLKVLFNRKDAENYVQSFQSSYNGIVDESPAVFQARLKNNQATFLIKTKGVLATKTPWERSFKDYRYFKIPANQIETLVSVKLLNDKEILLDTKKVLAI